MQERTFCSVTVAARLVDHLTTRPVRGASVRIAGCHQVPVAKEDGFYVFTDLPAGAADLLASAPGYQPFAFSFALPLPADDRLVLDVPGENELILAVRSAEEIPPADPGDPTLGRITFAARDLPQPIAAGTRVVSAKLVTRLAAPLEGEAVTEAVLETIGTGPDQLAANDVVRLVGERVVALRPGPSYRFGEQVRRLVGVVTDAVDRSPIAGATVSLSQVNDQAVSTTDVGTTAANTVQVATIGADDDKRVVGTRRDVRCLSDRRGGYCFHFPPRTDLDISTVTVTVTAQGYSSGSWSIELTEAGLFRRLQLAPA